MRLFTGIDLPSSVTSVLEQLLAQLRPTAHLKWSPVYNLHITVKFIGEWQEERLDELRSVLAGIPRRPPVPVDVRGLGWMPNPHRPRLFWAAINAPDLAAVAADTEAALMPLGIAKEDRPYTPHLTLARVRMPVPLQQTREAIAQIESTDFGSFHADRFWLYRSETGAANSVYTKLAEFPVFRMTPWLILIADYLIGCIPFGYLLVRLSTGQDVRSTGSGNIGATNVLRTTGRALGVATLLLDILKGFLAVWLMARVTDQSQAWMSAAALAVMFGHSFSVFLKFKGGKAVATFVGAFLYLTTLPLLCVLLLFIIVVAVTHYISLASILSAALFPFGVWLILHPDRTVVAAAAVAGAFIIWRHRANISRIRAGTEYVFRFRNPARAGAARR